MVAVGFVLPLLMALAFTLVVPKILAFLATDRCLDRGGRFNSERKLCELQTPDPQAAKP